MSTTVTTGKRFARPKQAASYLGIGISTLWAWSADRPNFPAKIKAGPRVTLFNLDELDQWLTAAQPV